MSMRRGRRSAGPAATRRGPGWPRRRSAGSSTTRSPSPGSSAWQLERDLPALLDACAEVLEPDGFMLLTAHTEGFDGDRLAHDLAAATRRPAASMDAGDLALATPDGRVLRLGAFARSTGRA